MAKNAASLKIMIEPLACLAQSLTNNKDTCFGLHFFSSNTPMILTWQISVAVMKIHSENGPGKW